MAKVRFANLADFPEMLAMGEDMHNESPRYRVHDFNVEKSAEILVNMHGRENCVLLVAEAAGHLTGMLLGFVAENTFCSGLVASELAVYVAPHARGSSAASRLVGAFEAWAFAHGASEISLGISTEVEADRTSKFYQRMGYAPTGSVLMKRVSITQH